MLRSMLTELDLSSCTQLRAGDGQDFFLLALLPIFVGITIWIHRQPQGNGKRFLVAANWALVVWLFAVVMELFSQTPGCKVFWSMMAFPGIGLLPVAWFLFVYRYTRSESGPILPWQWALLIAVPMAATLMAVTNPLHGLFYGAGTGPVDDRIGAAIGYRHGPLFFITAAMLYCFIAASFVLLVIGTSRSTGIARMLYVLLIFMTAIPTIANVGYIGFGINVAGFDPTPFLFSFVLLIYACLISLSNFFQISSIAKDMIFDNLPNAVLVLSRDGTIIASNRLAQSLFSPGGRGDKTVRHSEALDSLKALATSGKKLDKAPEISLGDEEFEVRLTPIYNPTDARKQNPIGFAFVFFEVTTRKQVQLALSKALQTTDAKLDEVLMQNRRYSDEVRTDPLTGLLNRRSLAEEFEAMTAARNPPIFAVIVDIDHFKAINDRLGHSIGDKVLIALGTCLRRGFREQDRVFRLGGEEFLILLADIDIQTLHSRIAGLREAVAVAGDILLHDAMSLRFSAGIAAWPSDADNLAQLLDSADKRLYSAKKSGRNRTVGPLAELA